MRNISAQTACRHRLTPMRLGIALFVLIVSITPSSWAAKIYIYSQKDGKTLITTAPDFSADNTLVRSYHPIAPVRVWPSTPKTARRVLQPLNSAYDALIQQLARKAGQDPRLIKAIVQVESNFNPQAVSPKGALGLMQLMPSTAARYEVDDPFDAQDNILGGTQYFSELMTKYNGNIQLALAAYNAGEAAVAQYRGIPPYPETRAYVESVVQLHRAYLGRQ